MDHTTQTGVTCMGNTDQEREWKKLSQRSNDLAYDIEVLESRIKYRDTLEKQLADKKAEFHAVNNKLRRLGIRMNQ